MSLSNWFFDDELREQVNQIIRKLRKTKPTPRTEPKKPPKMPVQPTQHQVQDGTPLQLWEKMD